MRTIMRSYSSDNYNSCSRSESLFCVLIRLFIRPVPAAPSVPPATVDFLAVVKINIEVFFFITGCFFYYCELQKQGQR